jgi:hypothetical protein
MPNVVYLYENRTVKSIEIILRSGEEGWGKIMEGVNLINIYYKHMCKCHNETSVQLIYNNKNHKKEKVTNIFKYSLNI